MDLLEAARIKLVQQGDWSWHDRYISTPWTPDSESAFRVVRPRLEWMFLFGAYGFDLVEEWSGNNSEDPNDQWTTIWQKR